MNESELDRALRTLTGEAGVAGDCMLISRAALANLPDETWTAVLPSAARNIVECAEGDGPAEFVDWDRVAVDLGLVGRDVVEPDHPG